MSNLFEPTQTYKPFHYPWAVELDDEHERMHWHQSEVPLGDDVSDWKLGKITPGEKEFITSILKMFTQSDVNVGEYYYRNLIPRFRNNEITTMLGGFATREKTHQRAYALLNDTLGLPESDYAAFLSYVEMKEKHEFMLDADTSTLPGLALALAKGVFNEGLSLFASFVMLLNFQRFGKMKGMCKIVEWSIKDETKHVEGVSRLFRTLCAEHPELVTDRLKHAVYDMGREAVRLEDAFIDLAYGQAKIEGLSALEVKAYIRYICDRRLVQLGLKPNFMVNENPLPWLDWILNAADHTNFFENKSAEYEVGGLQGEWEYEQAPGRRFRIYTKEGCLWCVRAKELLTSEGHSFEEVDLTEDRKRLAFYDQWGLEGERRSVPQIQEITVDGDVHVGGFTDLGRYLGA